ncbi:GH25 family lysozyme [Streptomyces cylindrosporus]|uniref:Peptidoglycan-binding protein n=1 Tax=Streptomyces cylindrosporus TaxID=2927583 RepID=A0ABS9YK78_9ACTN|nr:GH25 family lysozyme [Streptomyces cylindrosporus]MCI3277663.1 peptidoglycan-binding protein [Streptomyces cylindrosporus]
MTTNTCRGIDVSAYQSTQDWAAHKKDGVAFAFAKATEGEHTRDQRFDTHIAGIIKAGLTPGAYHLAWPTQDADAEAANYIAAVAPYARSTHLIHWLDLEAYNDGRNYQGRSDAQILAWATTWLAIVQTAFPTQRVGAYTSAADVAQGHIPPDTPLWFPRYPGPSVDTYAEAERAARPAPSGHTALFWQFTSSPLDRSICYMSADDLHTWATGGTTPAHPKYEPYPGRSFFLRGAGPAYGKRSPIFTAMGRRLVDVGCGHYKVGPGPVLGKADVTSYEAWQRQYNATHHKRWTGDALTWPPGRETWDALKVPKT